jgi:predicted enzyme related to lactoylglutathione lyase
MISGVHAIIFTRDTDAVRAFLRDVLELPSVDAGEGWPIFALPPAELAAHPADGAGHHELYLMCDDIEAAMSELERKGVEVSRPITEERWGRLTAITVPDGGELRLYQPKHRLRHTGQGRIRRRIRPSATTPHRGPTSGLRPSPPHRRW